MRCLLWKSTYMTYVMYAVFCSTRAVRCRNVAAARRMTDDCWRMYWRMYWRMADGGRLMAVARRWKATAR